MEEQPGIEMKPFTEADWFSFADIAGSKDDPPLVGVITLRGPGWTQQDLDEQYANIVISGIGVTIIAAESTWQLRCSFRAGREMVEMMVPSATVESLKRWGFTQIA